MHTHFPEKWVGEQVQTDESLIDALLTIGNKYVETQNTVFITSESWTTEHDRFSVNYPSPLYGAVVSATGNSGVNVSDPNHLLDFAQRASNNVDRVAVLNMSSTGPICDSSYIDPRDIDTAFAVGLDGHITKNLCATSFAAPRVAWYLAAAEAIRAKEFERNRWGRDLHDCLLSLRTSTQPGFGKMLFDPVKFLSAQHDGSCAASDH